MKHILFYLNCTKADCPSRNMYELRESMNHRYISSLLSMIVYIFKNHLLLLQHDNPVMSFLFSLFYLTGMLRNK